MKDFLLWVRRQVEEWLHINSSNIGPSECTVRTVHANTDFGRASEKLINNLGASVLGTIGDADHRSLYNQE